MACKHSKAWQIHMWYLNFKCKFIRNQMRFTSTYIYKCHILSRAFDELSLLVKYVNLMLEEKANVLVKFFDYT